MQQEVTEFMADNEPLLAFVRNGVSHVMMAALPDLLSNRPFHRRCVSHVSALKIAIPPRRFHLALEYAF